MPSGGRPSGGSDPRRRRDYMEWEAAQQQQAYRFEELDTEDDAYESRSPSDVLRFTGYDVGARRQNYYDEDLAYGDDYDELGEEYDERDFGGRWQMQMRRREEETARGAIRRMHRARLRGDGDAPLSREEIDILERRQLIPRGLDSTADLTSTKPTPPKLARKALPSKASAAKTRTTKSGRTTPTSAGPSRRTSDTTLAITASPPKRATTGVRAVSGPMPRRAVGFTPEPRDPDYRPSSSSSSRAPPSSFQELDREGRARSSSSAARYQGRHYDQQQYQQYPPYPPNQQYPPYPPYPPQPHAPQYPSYAQSSAAQYPQHQFQAYPGTRRNFSGPASFPARAPRDPRNPRPRVRSGLEREPIVISDDDEEEEEEDDELERDLDRGLQARGGSGSRDRDFARGFMEDEEEEDGDEDEGTDVDAAEEGDSDGVPIETGNARVATASASGSGSGYNGPPRAAVGARVRSRGMR